MSKAKFTKGPWVIFDERVGIVDRSDTQAYGMMLEIAYIDMHNFGEEEGKSNAYLIAAAREMYEEIERDIRMIEGFVSLDDGSYECEEAKKDLERKRFLLAKARGEHE